MKFGKRQIVLASLVLALGAAVYLNWQFAGNSQLPVGDTSSTTSELGAAQLVNNTYVETVNDNLPQGSGKDVLAQARLTRQTARDQAIELLDTVLANVESDTDAKQAAVEQASVIAQNILKETNVENVLQAKEYSETVATITDTDCTVMVAGEVKEGDTLIIQEVVMEQTGFPVDKIKIIGSK